ncbi:ABC transporter permease subunit [Curtobacterium sp. VKM Ac-2861]|uniref:ABC transporter permease n=1 Tax=unclassified Curtobacterium TaxID=257496 RepID=UPI001042FBA9|nr:MULTISPECIES: ABC transporter permease subunit [unclassified Curtobacterium]NQW90795.1 ABC transporter permease subunit [Curtobacterium sp. VKM Ac-2861]TCU48856.1 glycine betaine/proline transport system permease protein [Curtobacterium sp. PhB146]TDW40854.1 glycine betaine/proline transport system permease protein [Curtobacterium sp. PhB42]TDW53398.1 glycine betaine/proline transport system permease protein [Curtobacterium sp. PhB190]
MTTLFGFRLPLGDAVDAIVEWITTYLGGVFDVIAAIFTFFYEWIEYFLTTPPFWAVIVVLVAVAFWAKGWKLALGTLVGLAVIVSIGEWSYAMESLALVVVAAGIAVVLSLPLGVWAARSDAASRTIKPVLDFMQTTPAFVYLIPALILFGIGPVPGIVATIVFAMAPGVRLTELGIRGVSSEVVEAGAAFGSSPWRILRQIQLPLARPSIMAGVNQVIMLSLSMVVIAGMVGAGGLGGQIVAALNRIDVGLGSEAGISVVILAIVLDRMTAAFGGDRKKRAPSRTTAATAPTGDDDQESATQQAEQPVPVGA